MRRPPTLFWLLTLTLLGNLIRPALALRDALPGTAHTCPRDGSKAGCCCCPVAPVVSTVARGASVRAPCACQIVPDTAPRGPATRLSPAPESAPLLVVPVASFLFTAPVRDAPPPLRGELTPIPVPPSRAPDSGRAPPVSRHDCPFVVLPPR